MPDHPPTQTADDRTHSLAPPASTAGGDPTPAAGPHPAVSERYVLGDEIARGGMGVVYRAADTALGREVAVKVLQDRFGPASAAAHRFADEARITGQLQHPGIPPVHDFGTLPDGRPFLAMKLIRGRTLADLLDGTPDRGRLVAAFEGVCQAVAYAHAHGVVHRDLKPANVMVGSFGEVQVMDWGLAKVLTGGRTEPDPTDPGETTGTEIRSHRGADALTQAGSLLGTPAYMAPEQAIGAVDQIDARTDVFGLGGILCAVLTGKPPYVGATAESTRQLAARAVLADALARLDGCGAEPDLVVLARRCLAAEKADRPADATEVAKAVAALRAGAERRARDAEVERERAAVRAAEERKRRRVVLAAAAAVAAVLAGGAGVATWQAVRATDAEAETAAQLTRTREAEGVARAERDNARAAEAKATAAAELARTREVEAREAEADTRAFDDFLVTKFLAATRPAGVQSGIGVDVKVSDALRAAEADLGAAFAGRPKAEATARHAIGVTWRNLSAHDKAEAHLRRAVELRTRELGAAAPDTLESVNSLAIVLMARGRHADAEPLYKQAVAGFEAAHGPLHPNTLAAVSNLADLYVLWRRYDDARPLYERALAGWDVTREPDHPDALATVHNLAELYSRRGRYDDARPLAERALAGRERHFGPDHPSTLASASCLGTIHYRRGDHAAARPLYERALAGRERHLGPDHTDTLTSVNNLAALHFAQGRFDDARPLLERAYAGIEKALGPNHPTAAAAANNLGRAELETGRYAAAAAHLGRALPVYERANDPTVFDLRAGLGLALLGAGRPAEAEPHLRAGYDELIGRPTLNNGSRRLLRRVAAGLAAACDQTGRPWQAAGWRVRLAAVPPDAAPPPREVRR